MKIRLLPTQPLDPRHFTECSRPATCDFCTAGVPKRVSITRWVDGIQVTMSLTEAQYQRFRKSVDDSR